MKRNFKAVPGKGIVSRTFNDFQNMKQQYPCMRSFKDRNKESGHIRDLIDDLESHGIEYSVYDDKTDPGCTVFYQKEINSSTTHMITSSNWPRDHYFWDFEIPEDMEAFEEAQELYLNDIELDVVESMNLFLEPSIQGSRGGMFVYDESGADNDTIEVDYRKWCIDEISMAASSSSPDEFRSAFEAYLYSLMEDAGWVDI